jgi:hypothetical protein
MISSDSDFPSGDYFGDFRASLPGLEERQSVGSKGSGDNVKLDGIIRDPSHENMLGGFSSEFSMDGGDFFEGKVQIHSCQI